MEIKINSDLVIDLYVKASIYNGQGISTQFTKEVTDFLAKVLTDGYQTRQKGFVVPPNPIMTIDKNEFKSILENGIFKK